MELEKWKREDSYFGETFYDYYLAPARTRDSDCLAKTNFEAALDILGGEKDHVIVCRFNHWGCGYFDQILVHENAPKEILDTLREIKETLEDFGVLDENLYYEKVSEYQQECYDDLEGDIFDSFNFERCEKTGDVLDKANKLRLDYIDFRCMVTGLMDNDGTIWDYFKQVRSEFEYEATHDRTINDNVRDVMENELLEKINYGNMPEQERSILSEVYDMLQRESFTDNDILAFIDLKASGIAILERIKEALKGVGAENNNIDRQMDFTLAA